MALHMQNGMGKNHLAEHCTLPHTVPNRPMFKCFTTYHYCLYCLNHTNTGITIATHHYNFLKYLPTYQP